MVGTTSFPPFPGRAASPPLSAFLAGMKRSTGLTAAGENKDMSKWIDKYLGVGEWVMDQSVAIAGSSGWFERTR
ncbi:hypothetical protein COL922a_004381 [Colletotrichum nupharicola]|nr:hypothetical protein COL922a_004381 [Colletotrichum nupharicola]